MDQNPSESPSTIRETRRRRTRSLILPQGKTERAIYVNDIAKRLVPGLDFYLLSLLCGAVLAAGILLDHPAIYILAALAAPFMTPLVGLGFSTAVGSFGFFMQSLGGLAIGSALVFLMGALGGWASKLFQDLPVNQASFHIDFSFPDFLLLSVGTILAVYMTVKAPKKRSLVASVALAYEVYLPVGVAGFGLTSGINNFFQRGPADGRREHSSGNHARHCGTAVLSSATCHVLWLFINRGDAGCYRLWTLHVQRGSHRITAANLPGVGNETLQKNSRTIHGTFQHATAAGRNAFSSTPTNTLVPTRTPTVTNTPRPPDVFATINEPQGVYIRQNPCTNDEHVPKSSGGCQ
jgi:hypothetical protein